MVFYDQQQKQKYFEKAHNFLMSYILDCFNTEIDVTHGLNALLPKCQLSSISKADYYCDGRPWTRIDKIYCPHMKLPCSFFDSSNFTNSRYERMSRPDTQDLADVIKNIKFEPSFSFIDAVNMSPQEYPYKISGFVNSLVEMRPHMRCKCGKHFTAEFQYAKKITARINTTVFDCPDLSMEHSVDTINHDKGVYLNYCLHCHEIIDSRECKLQDVFGYWICMNCGGSREHTPGSICPNCGCTDPDKLSKKAGDSVVCDSCGYRKRSFSSRKFYM